MYTESFDIEFEVPGSPDRYFEFELFVKGGWITDEVGGGEMGSALDIQETTFDEDMHVDIEINFINKWIEQNQHAIRKMFAIRILKYDD
jgi:hypothetical protein